MMIARPQAGETLNFVESTTSTNGWCSASASVVDRLRQAQVRRRVGRHGAGDAADVVEGRRVGGRRRCADGRRRARVEGGDVGADPTRVARGERRSRPRRHAPGSGIASVATYETSATPGGWTGTASTGCADRIARRARSSWTIGRGSIGRRVGRRPATRAEDDRARRAATRPRSRRPRRRARPARSARPASARGRRRTGVAVGRRWPGGVATGVAGDRRGGRPPSRPALVPNGNVARSVPPASTQVDVGGVRHRVAVRGRRSRPGRSGRPRRRPWPGCPRSAPVSATNPAGRYRRTP